MAQDTKDTIYIDIDDEITTIIDKLQSSPKKIVAIVLPKRAAVFQSIVNMKLLKRTAEQSKKHVVLITSEAALLPLAGAVGLRVAKTLQSKPAIPEPPAAAQGVPVVSSDDAPLVDDDKPIDKAASVGSLAGLADDDTLEIDNSIPAEPPEKTVDRKKKPRNKKIKIPNFEKARTKVILGVVALIALIGLWVLAFRVLPKATIVLQTDTTTLDTKIEFVADTNATELDAENAILPALSKEFRKTDAEKVPATGKKDLGEKATGSVTLSLSDCSSSQVTVPAGTTVSTDNLSFVTQESATMQSVEIGGNCQNDSFPNISSETVAVVAGSAGDQFNIDGGKTFSVSGFSTVSGSNGSAMTGGTSKIVKIVTKEDVDKAKDAIAKRTGDEAPEDLQDDLRKEGYFPISETLTAGEPTVTTSTKVGDEASDVTVTSTTVFTMVGVKEDDLKTVVEADAKEKIDPSKQVIQDNGLVSASFAVADKVRGRMTISMNTKVVAGPDLEETVLKQEVAGKKRGDIQNILGGRPGIRDVEVRYSPFWVQSTPTDADRITIVFETADIQNDQPEGE